MAYLRLLRPNCRVRGQDPDRQPCVSRRRAVVPRVRAQHRNRKRSGQGALAGYRNRDRLSRGAWSQRQSGQARGCISPSRRFQATIEMRQASVYCIDCLCGRHIETQLIELDCPTCKRKLRIEWDAERKGTRDLQTYRTEVIPVQSLPNPLPGALPRIHVRQRSGPKLMPGGCPGKSSRTSASSAPA